tara:strand:+ start:176 stop:376 length:201 start_codon:yes stop_codon:yes gene_type:complete
VLDIPRKYQLRQLYPISDQVLDIVDLKKVELSDHSLVKRKLQHMFSNSNERLSPWIQSIQSQQALY